MESSRNGLALHCIKNMFLEELLHPQWMSVHRCHESQTVKDSGNSYTLVLSVLAQNILIEMWQLVTMSKETSSWSESGSPLS